MSHVQRRRQRAKHFSGYCRDISQPTYRDSRFERVQACTFVDLTVDGDSCESAHYEGNYG